MQPRISARKSLLVGRYMFNLKDIEAIEAILWIVSGKECL
jgi:hypothetical protein